MNSKHSFFNDKNEAYEKYLFNEDLSFIRQMLILSAALYSAFGLIDRWLELDNLFAFTVIRFYIVSPLVLIVFIISYHKSFYKLHQYILTTLYMIAGVGIVTMVVYS